jgi:23S rRNA (adenine2503-C2)-methyltransferase
MVMKDICGLTAEEIFCLIEPSGYSLSHAIAISNSIYKHGATTFSEIKSISKNMKNYLESEAVIGTLNIIKSELSIDNTIKYLFRTETGKEFETVYIPDNKRITVCVSTQSGCRMGCYYCATGRYGFHGNLTAGEIVSQVISIPDAEKVTHVVFMGMGEPMDNLDEVLKACNILTAEWGVALSPRNVTVSTVGITPAVNEFLKRSSCNLTISLYSPFTEERKRIIPSEKLYPVIDIIDTLKSFPKKKSRRFTISYMMISNMNDTDSHLEALISLLIGSEIRVNLLPYHIVSDDQNVSASKERMQIFKHNLVISGISASIRKSRGADISAACGLLAGGFRM